MKIIKPGILIIVFLVAGVLVANHMIPKRTYHLHGITPGEPSETVDY